MGIVGWGFCFGVKGILAIISCFEERVGSVGGSSRFVFRVGCRYDDC